MPREPDLIIKVDPTTPDVTDLIETIIRTHVSAGHSLHMEIYLQQEKPSQHTQSKPRRTRRASGKIRKPPQKTIQGLLADVQHQNGTDNGRPLSDPQLARKLGGGITANQVYNLRHGRARTTADNHVIHAIYVGVFQEKTLAVSRSSRKVLQRLHSLPQTRRSSRPVGHPPREKVSSRDTATASPLNGAGTHAS